MPRDIPSALLMLAVLALPSALLAADPLSSVRREVREADPEPPRAEPEESEAPRKKKKKKRPQAEFTWEEEPCEPDDDASDTLSELAVGGAVLVLSAPYWGPHALLEGRSDSELYFAPAPYEHSPGSMIADDLSDPAIPLETFAWATRVRAEYLDDFDGLTGYRSHVLAEHANRWGFDSELNYWRQDITPGLHDELWTGDANLVFRFAQNERIQLRSGVGAAWLSDDLGTDVGFNFTYGGDYYPLHPLVISADLDAGWLGEAGFIHLRSTIGLNWKQVEVYTGYDYLEIGDAQLDGLIAGFRVLF